jgi:hypothetical protein
MGRGATSGSGVRSGFQAVRDGASLHESRRAEAFSEELIRRATSQGEHCRPEGENMRPEDRGCLQRLVHLEPLIDARQPLFGRPRPVMATPRKTMPRARQTWQSCSSATSSADRRFVKKPELARPYVEETHVEEREGVVQASCQLQPTFGPQGATGEAATGLPVSSQCSPSPA